jgi:hypothetical protein
MLEAGGYEDVWQLLRIGVKDLWSFCVAICERAQGRRVWRPALSYGHPRPRGEAAEGFSSYSARRFSGGPAPMTTPVRDRFIPSLLLTLSSSCPQPEGVYGGRSEGSIGGKIMCVGQTSGTQFVECPTCCGEHL